MTVESCRETEQQADQCLSVSAEQDALPEQTGHCSVCQQLLCHKDSYIITFKKQSIFKHKDIVNNTTRQAYKM